MSVLCMRTTLARGWRHGLAIGAGIAIGDALYGAVATLGLASLSGFLLLHEKSLHIAAGLILMYLGLTSFWKQNAGEEQSAVSVRGWRWDLATSIVLTLTNPPTIIMFAAVFAALAPVGGLRALNALAAVTGVFVGSLLWWSIIVGFVAVIRHGVGSAARRWIDWISGLALASLGAVELRRGLLP